MIYITFCMIWKQSCCIRGSFHIVAFFLLLDLWYFLHIAFNISLISFHTISSNWKSLANSGFSVTMNSRCSIKGFLWGWWALFGRNDFDTYTNPRMCILLFSLLCQSSAWYTELTLIFLAKLKAVIIFFFD